MYVHVKKGEIPSMDELKFKTYLGNINFVFVIEINNIHLVDKGGRPTSKHPREVKLELF